MNEIKARFFFPSLFQEKGSTGFPDFSRLCNHAMQACRSIIYWRIAFYLPLIP